MKKHATMLTLLVLAAPAWLMAQDSPAPEAAKPADHFYKLNLAVEETNAAGQVTNTRSYVATVETGPVGQQIRTGSRIPVATGGDHGNTQFQYIDLGVNFDVRKVEEVRDKLSFSLTAEISSLSSTIAGGPMSGEPVIRQNKWNSNVLIPLNRPTVVFSADDLDDKGKMQVELTATRID